MVASVWHLRAARTLGLALISIGVLGTLDPAAAAAKLTPQQCYKEDSECTQFCGDVTGTLRYECFGICDRMLNRCLDTGEWTDSLEVDPGTGNPPDPRDQLSAFFLRIVMTMSDTDGDGTLSPKEIQVVKERFKREAATAPKAPATPKP